MDEKAFKTQVFCHSDAMYRFANRLLQNEADAKDAVQQVMLKLWLNRQSLQKVNNLIAFALTSIRHECLNRIKKKSTDMGHTAKLVAMQDHKTETQSDIDRKMIIGLMNRLPEKQRLVLHLKDVEGLEISDIASILETEENALRVNLARARQKMREQLQNISEYERKQLQ